MTTYFVAFLCALMMAMGLTLVVRNLALRLGWVDRIKDSRKIHLKPIPRLGGIAIVGGFFAPLTGLLLVDSAVGETFRTNSSLVWGLFAGGLSIAALGLYDDFFGAGARIKFLVQFAVAGVLYEVGFRIQQVAIPFGSPIELGFLALPVTLLWIVGIVNAMNLIDGLDGLAGGVAFFAVTTNFVLALAQGNVLLALAMAALAGAVLGFLVFNFNPASIFMGDTGSMFLGFVLAVTSLKTSSKTPTTVAMLVPILALGLPIMDTLLAMVRRALLGRSMFSADKEHIHHRLMSRLVMSHRKAVVLLYGVCCLFCLSALGVSYSNGPQGGMLLAAVGTTVFVLMRKLGYLNLKEASHVAEVRHRNGQLRVLVKETHDRVRAARDFQGVWEAVRPIAEVLGLSRLELRFVRQDDGVVFETKRPGGSALPLEVQVELALGEARYGTLSLAWRDGRPEVNRDEELALELIADSIAKAAAAFTARHLADPARVVALRKS